MRRISISQRTTASGMAFLLSLAFFTSFIGCGRSDQPATAETKKFLPADQSNGDAAAPADNAAYTRAANSPAFATGGSDATSGNGQSPSASPASRTGGKSTPPGP